jgi:hypothetical protein
MKEVKERNEELRGKGRKEIELRKGWIMEMNQSPLNMRPLFNILTIIGGVRCLDRLRVLPLMKSVSVFEALRKKKARRFL